MQLLVAEEVVVVRRKEALTWMCKRRLPLLEMQSC